MAVKIKCYKAKLEDFDGAEGSYIARVALFGDEKNVDKDGDFFKSNAFDKTIKKRKGIFPGVWMHDARRPVALGNIEKDSKGLIVHAQINLDTQDGRETHSNMKKGIAGDHSFAFNPNMKDADRLEDDSGHFTGFGFGEVELLEFSPLTIGFAANDGANLIALKWRNSYQDNDIEDNDSDEDVDSIDTGGVDSLEQAKEMAALIANIKGITNTITQFNERS